MKKLLYFLLSLMLSLSVVVLTSCENFMDGSDVQSHFEELIDIANAKSYTIIVSQDEAMGSFLSSGDKDCKVGYTIDLQFTVNSENYIYKGLEAVSKNNQTRSRADCVEFIETSSEVEEKNGIYKVQVKLLKDADDVMIKPKCVLIPKVTDIIPVFAPGGYDQDSPITITFNKSVDPASFGEFGFISIFSDETDLKDYFDAPTFVDNNTKLVIAPKQDRHIITPDTGKIMTINLSLNFTNEKDADGQVISGNKTYQYRINEAYGNREISTTLVREDENSKTGTFDKTGEIKCTVGYSYNLQFTLRKADYVFNGLEAVSKNNNADFNASKVVEFETIKSDDDLGIYTVQVKIKAQSDDILIKPKCILIPKVKNITPVNEFSGCFQDETITIEFNKPVDPETFGDFACISIFGDDGEDLKSEYFDTPVFFDNNTRLKITPIKKILPPDSNKKKVINIGIDFKNLKDSDGLSIEAFATYSYRINDNFNNQQISEISVEAAANNNSGTFDRTGQIQCSVGYDVNLQFKLNKSDYIFRGLKVEQRSSNASIEFNAQDVSVSYQEIDNTGVYDIVVHMNNYTNNIKISPDCVLIPRITQITPAYAFTGCLQDEPIEIRFNKPVDPETFGNFECISISTDGEDLKSEYFDTPVFDTNNRILKITPKQNVHIIKPDSGKKQDINITIDFTNLKDEEGVSIESYASYSYRINDSFSTQQRARILVEEDTNAVTGTFDRKGEIECTVDSSFDLVFALKKADYIFREIVAVNSADRATPLSSSIVSLDVIDSDDEKGIYTVRVTVKTNEVGILIKPNCILIPRITQITPAYVSTGCLQDEPIEIKFNKPVDPETFGDFECISIFADGDDLKSEYFYTPVFNTNNTILKITPKANVHIIKPDSGKKKDINIKIDFTNLKDEAGLSIESYASYSYRINDSFSTQRRTRILVEEDTNAVTGTFVRKGEIECTVDNGIDLVFTVKKADYIFKELVAVNSADRATPLSSSVVEFEIVDVDNEKGIYTVRTTVKTDDVGILIKPRCSLVPKVVAMGPAYDAEGCEQDTIITVEFNKPIVATEYFSPAISDAFGTNLAEYFDKPYYSDDSKTLYIPTVNTKRILDINGTVESKDIIVKIDLSNIKDLEGNFASGVYQHKYRINRGLDSEKPTLTSVTLYPTSEKKKTLTNKAFEEWNSSGTGYGDFGTNHIGDSVYIEAEGYDADSGIAEIIVKEKIIRYTDGTSVTAETVTTHLACIKDDTSGKYYANYKFDTSLEGVIELKIQIGDYAGNISDTIKTFYVIKDTMVDSGRIKFNEEISELGTDLNDLLAAVQVVTDDTQDVELTLASSAKDIFYSNYSTNFEIEAYWGYSETEITEPITTTNNTFTFTRDVTKFVFIKLVCKDAIGNEREVIKRMAPRVEIYQGEDEGSFNIVNLRSYLMNCNINAGSQIQVADYAKFLYQFCIDPEDKEKDEELLVDVIWGSHEGNYNVYSEAPTVAMDLEGTVNPGSYGNLYMVATVGDFLSPRSNNFVTFDITFNNMYTISNVTLSSGRDESGYETVKSFGPAGKEYIKNNFKVTTEGIKNSGNHKVVIEDYMTEAGKAAGIDYSFYIVSCTLHENGWIMDTPDSPQSPATGHEAPIYEFDTSNSINSNIPEIFLNSTKSYKIYITAYDRENKKKYVPFEFKTVYYHSDGDGMGNGKLDIAFSTEEGGHLPECCSFYVNSSTELTDSLDLTGDYAAPYLTHDSNPFSNPVYFDINVPIDSASGDYNGFMPGYEEGSTAPTMKCNADGKYELSYYIIPNVSNNIKLSPTYTINELRTQYADYERTIEYTPSASQTAMELWDQEKIKIYYGTLKEGLYTISFIVEDIYGNAAVYTYPFINSTLGYRLPYTKELHELTWEDMSGTTQKSIWWDFSIETEDYDYIKFIQKNGQQVSTINAQLYFAQQPWNGPDSEEGGLSWEWLAGDSLCYEYPMTIGDYGIEQGYTLEPTFETRVSCNDIVNSLDLKWAKITGYYGFEDSDTATGKGYFYTDYTFMGTDDVCNVKNCMNGLNGVQVFFDNSVLVHTMYSQEKLTNSIYDKDASLIWETKGVETGLDIYPTSRIPKLDYSDPTYIPGSPYYIPDLEPEPTIDETAFQTRTYGLDKYSDIPEGFWYTTIFHFADGTVVMTDIKQK